MSIDSKNLPDSVLRCMAPGDKPKGNAGLTFPEAQEKADTRAEREIQNQITTDLTRRGIPYCLPRIDRKSTIRKGWPDITFAYRGRFIALEVKTSTGKLRPDQRQCLAALRDEPCRGLAVVVRSLADVIIVIRWVEREYMKPGMPLPERFTRLDQ